MCKCLVIAIVLLFLAWRLKYVSCSKDNSMTTHRIRNNVVQRLKGVLFCSLKTIIEIGSYVVNNRLNLKRRSHVLGNSWLTSSSVFTSQVYSRRFDSYSNKFTIELYFEIRLTYIYVPKHILGFIKTIVNFIRQSQDILISSGITR